MYLTVQGPEDADILQDNLSILKERGKAWDLESNPPKCQVLHISRSHRPTKHSYTIVWGVCCIRKRENDRKVRSIADRKPEKKTVLAKAFPLFNP